MLEKAASPGMQLLEVQGSNQAVNVAVKPKLLNYAELVDDSLWDRHHNRSLSANHDFQNTIILASTVGLIITDLLETLTWRAMSNQPK